MTKRIFVAGATGYIGGSVAAHLAKNGYKVTGLTRSDKKSPALKALGIEPVIGDLSDLKLLAEQAKQADVTINCAGSDAAEAVDAILAALEGTNKMFIQNSGSTVVADRGKGERSEKIFDEDSDFNPQPEKQARVDMDRRVCEAAKKGVHSVVICPCLIYGEGLGLEKESQQIPLHVEQAIKSGVARCCGKGENIWSTVHIKDLVDLYLLVVKQPAEPGSFFFAENGEISFREIADGIREALHLTPPVEEWSMEAACKEWTEGRTIFGLASNSRVRAKKARALGWKPVHDSAKEDIKRSCAAMTSAASV